MTTLLHHARRTVLAGLLTAPAVLAAAWRWWTKIPPLPGDAATWTPAHEGRLDATGLYEHEVTANLQAMKEQR